MDRHDAVSSEGQGRPGGVGDSGREDTGRKESGMLDGHDAVSSEGQGQQSGVGATRQVADFAGTGAEGGTSSLEEVAGFDPARALQEGLQSEDIQVTEALEALPEAGTVEFLEPETVCGNDDRVRISPATAVPWRWNCQLIITMANGSSSRCTGWFIGPRTVMTAGHCLFSHSAGGWARSIEVIPGMDGASRPFGSQIGTSFRSVGGWTRDANPEYDYGAIILPNSTLGNRVGFFGFAALPDAELQNLLVNNAGYAGDKPFGTLWFNAGRVTTVLARRLLYMIDTFGGHSGSAVWRLSGGQRHSVGIHGYGGCPNKAVRITQPVFNNMLAWKNA